MYIGLAADPTWIQEVFGVQTAAQIDIDKTRLLDRETPASQRVRTVIGMWDYIAKGGIILEKFSLYVAQISPKKGAKSLSWALFTQRKDASRRLIWHFILDIWVKVKNFMRLSREYWTV